MNRRDKIADALELAAIAYMVVVGWPGALLYTLSEKVREGER